MKEGNDDFKRCFVMFAMITMLAPTFNRQADFRFIRALNDVDEIKNFNWCGYVLDYLATSLKGYSHSQKYVAGCVLLLQICYFQRLKFRGLSLRKSLPLIKYWTLEKVRKRLKDEGGEYGIGQLDDGYPITNSAKDTVDSSDEEELEAEATDENEIEQGTKDEKVPKIEIEEENVCDDEGLMFNDSLEKEVQEHNKCEKQNIRKEQQQEEIFQRSVTFGVPKDIMTNNEIEAISKNESEKRFLTLKRNMKLFSHQCEKDIEYIKIQSDGLTQSKHSPMLSQLDPMFSDPSFWEHIDRVTNHYMEAKKLEENFPTLKVFRVDEALKDQSQGMDVHVDDLFKNFVQEQNTQSDLDFLQCDDAIQNILKDLNTIDAEGEVVDSSKKVVDKVNFDSNMEIDQSNVCDKEVVAKETGAIVCVEEAADGTGVCGRSSSCALEAVVGSEDCPQTTSSALQVVAGNEETKKCCETTTIRVVGDVGRTMCEIEGVQGTEIVIVETIICRDKGIDDDKIISAESIVSASMVENKDNEQQEKGLVVSQPDALQQVQSQCSNDEEILRIPRTNRKATSDAVINAKGVSVKDVVAKKYSGVAMKRPRSDLKRATTKPVMKQQKEVLKSFVCGYSPATSKKVYEKKQSIDVVPNTIEQYVDDDDCFFGAFISYNVAEVVPGGNQLPLVSSMFRKNNKLLSQMKTTRLQVADHCLVDNQDFDFS
ncbi:Elongation factor 1-alpha [Bienertia sinuspersici]